MQPLVLVYRTFNTGGIETLIVRWANQLANLGRKVIVATYGGELESLLDAAVSSLTYRNSTDLAAKLRQLPVSLADLRYFSFDPTSAYTVLNVQLLTTGTFNNPHVTGVYHPRAYFEFERFYQRGLNERLLRALQPEGVIFCNGDCRRTHAEEFGLDLSGADIIPVPVHVREPRWSPPVGKGLRIVSVGRLTAFKAYNWAIPAMVERLRATGLDCSWDIWGDGPRASIQADIDRRHLSEHVRLCSTAPYEQLPQILGESHLFVGMGTSALEAAMAGLPTIVACDEEPELCYGYLCDVPPGNFGERLPQPPTVRIADLIGDFAAMTKGQQEPLSRRCRDVALRHSMPEFVEQVDRKLAQPAKRRSETVLKALAATHRVREIKDGIIGRSRPRPEPSLPVTESQPEVSTDQGLAPTTMSGLPPPPNYGMDGPARHGGQTLDKAIQVSFVMLSYRQEKLVREAVRGILAQDYPNLEIILSDDCSPDSTFAAIREEVEAYSGPHRVIVRQPARNLGLIPHLYDAVAQASGELIVVGAGDDISVPQRVSRLTAVWRESGADALCSGWQSIDDAGRPIGRGGQAASDLAIDRYFEGSERWQIAGATAAYTPAVFREIPCPGSLFAEDFYLTLALRWRGRKIAYLPEALVQYRVHAGAMTSKRSIDLKTEEAHVRRWSGRMAETLRYFADEVRRGDAGGGAWGQPVPANLAAIEEDIAFNAARAKWDRLSLGNRLGLLRHVPDPAKRRWMVPRLFGLAPVALARSLRAQVRGDARA